MSPIIWPPPLTKPLTRRGTPSPSDFAFWVPMLLSISAAGLLVVGFAVLLGWFVLWPLASLVVDGS